MHSTLNSLKLLKIVMTKRSKILLFISCFSYLCILATELKSPFAEGYWVKIGIKESGVYKLPFDTLRAWGFDDPECIAVYGGISNWMNLPHKTPKWELSYNINSTTSEIPIIYDSTQTQCYLFYADGCNIINNHTGEIEKFNWDVRNYYYITNKESQKSIRNATHGFYPINDTITYSQKTTPLLIPDTFIEVQGDAYPKYASYLDSEETKDLIIPSQYNISNEKKALELSFIITSKTTKSKLHIQTTAKDSAISINNCRVGTTIKLQIPLESTTSEIAISSIATSLFITNASIYGNIPLKYNNTPIIATYTFNNKQTNKWIENDTSLLHIKTQRKNIQIWDISLLDTISRIPLKDINEGLGCCLKRSAITNKKFAIFRVEDIQTPKYICKVKNNDILEILPCDYLIISHPDFLTEAKLLANFRNTNNNLSTRVINSNDIYNIFSSGKKDPKAIRTYIQYLYKNSLQHNNPIKYLLLFGHGQRACILPQYQPFDKIPTYSLESFGDLFYGTMKDSMGLHTAASHGFDITVGRIPALSKEQALTSVNKTMKHETSYGLWKNRIIMTAGYKDSSQSFFPLIDSLSNRGIINNNEYLYYKLYYDSFTNDSCLTNKITQTLNNGCEILCYDGHSDLNGWWKSLTTTQMQTLKNKQHPIVISNSCHFSEFDTKDLSPAESLLFNKEGGAVAIIGGARTMKSKIENHHLPNICSVVTQIDPYLTLGDFLKKFNYNNKQVIIGDPLIQLGNKYQYITNINYNTKTITGSIDLNRKRDRFLYIEITQELQDTCLSNEKNTQIKIQKRIKTIHVDSIRIYEDRFEYEIPTFIFNNTSTITASLYSFSDKQNVEFAKIPLRATDHLNQTPANNPTIFFTKNSLQITNNKDVKQIIIYNMAGHCVKRTTPHNTIDISVLPKGIYILKIIMKDNTHLCRKFSY